MLGEEVRLHAAVQGNEDPSENRPNPARVLGTVATGIAILFPDAADAVVVVVRCCVPGLEEQLFGGDRRVLKACECPEVYARQRVVQPAILHLFGEPDVSCALLVECVLVEDVPYFRVVAPRAYRWPCIDGGARRLLFLRSAGRALRCCRPLLALGRAAGLQRESCFLLGLLVTR